METFKTPRNKLALTYLTIIMVLSVGFSILFYNQTAHVAQAGFRRQARQLRNNIYFVAPGSIERMRDEGINRFNDNVLSRLVLLNTGMLIVGGFLSYYLAKRSLEPMEEALAAQSRFTSDAAHELRTPLTVMKSEIEVGLRSKALKGSETKEILQSNLEEIAKLETLTEALLRLAKNSHQPDQSSWTKVRITNILEAAVERVAPQAAKQNITFELPASSKVSVRADYDQLVELFVILLENAVKYGKDASVVKVTALQNESMVVVSVDDKGIGIAKKDLPHIFDRFYRADQSRNKSESSGYGLGLSVAEAIVKSHEGTITATGKPGVGSTFTVTLNK